MRIEQPSIGITSGAQSISGVKTFSDGVVVTTADTLLVGGVIVPQTLNVNLVLNALSVSTALFIADAAYQVTAVRVVWGVAGGLAAALNIEKLTSTTAPGSGTAILSSDIDLTATANTVTSGSLTGTVGNLQFATGNRLGVKLTGTLTGLVGCAVSVTLKRI